MTEDHREADYGFAAAVTDRGLRHRRNEDAFELATTADGRAVVAVCDGVSSSANPDQASAAAAAAAVAALRPLLDGPPAADEEVAGAVRAAVAAAHAAVGHVPGTEPGGYPAAPSTTIVTAVVDPGRVVVASVGDSRAYWLAPTDPAGRKLTVDDSLAEMAIAQGVPADTAYASPQAHVITRWLGANVGGSDPEVGVYTTDHGGVLLVCTDGLWNYFEPPERLAQLVHASGTDSPLRVARTLVDAANGAGGVDHVTVAVVAVAGTGPDGEAAG
jgi:serine/threonine protein phosphatase PrpC